MQHTKLSNAKYKLTDESVFKPPRIALLKQEQWSYIQRRYNMSRRELQVAELVCMGLSNEEIAEDLRIKPGTVKTHLRNIYRRIRARNKIAMLLKIVEQAVMLSADSQAALPAPIVGAKKLANKTFNLAEICKEGK